MNTFLDAPLPVVRNNNVKRVFFLRLGAVGDLLVATAALEATQARFPNAEIWVAGPKLWLQLLLPQTWPRVTGIYVLPDKKAMSGDLWIPEGPLSWQIGKQNQSLEAVLKHCDASVNLRLESMRYSKPLAQARLGVRVGTGPWWSKHYVTHWSPWLGRDPILHERDRLLHIVRAPQRTFWPLRLTRTSRQELKRMQTQNFTQGEQAQKYQVHQAEVPESVVAEWRNKTLPLLKTPDQERAQALTSCEPNRYVFVNPTASRWEKAWPKEKFRAFCAAVKPWLAEQGLELLLLGSPQESEWLEAVNENVNVPLIQPPQLADLMDALAFARALVTNTSSLQFFANAMKVPAFVLMGRTFPARWGPLGEHDFFLCGQLPEKKPDDVFLEDFMSYDSLTVEQVTTGFQQWLAQLPEKPL